MQSSAINPLVADVGSPPIPEAQGWTRRYDGRFGPLIDLSQAVPGNAPHPALLERMAASAGSALGAKYGPISGDADLRDAYAADLSTTYKAALRRPRWP
jgi:aspartate/methionine/tyrosine aminotransferase